MRQVERKLVQITLQDLQMIILQILTTVRESPVAIESMKISMTTQL